MSTEGAVKQFLCIYIHNSQKLKMTWMSITRRMDKSIVIYSLERLLFSNFFKKAYATCNSMAESPEDCFMGKTRSAKDYIP